MLLMSGPVVIRGGSDGKLALRLTAGKAETGALLSMKLGRESEDAVADGTVERVDGTVADEGMEDMFSELLLTGSKGDGTSGTCGPGKLEAPAGKEVLKPGYCIGWCRGGGIDNPGGGRSRVC